MPKQTSSRQPAPNITSITYWRKFAVHRVFYLGIAALFGISAIAYFGGPSGMGPDAAAERGAAAIAVVNGEPIPRAIYQTQWERYRQQMRQMRQFGGGPTTPTQEAMEQGRILDRLVLNAVLTGLAKKRGLSVSDAAIEKEIATFKQSGPNGKPLSDSDLDKLLREQGGSLDQLRNELREGLLPQILTESIADQQKITEDDLQKSFDEVKVRRILFPVTGGPMTMGAKPDAQAKRDAEDVLAKIKAGANFASMANEFSKDPSNQQTDLDPKTKKPVTRKNGGLLNSFDQGWYKRGSGQPKEFEDAAFALEKGQLSDVVKTPEGYQIIKVEDKRRKLPDNYAKDKAELMKQEKMTRAQKPIADTIDAARKSAKVQWNDPALEWRYEYARQAMNPMMDPTGADKGQDAFVEKLRAYAEKNKDDGAAHLVLGQLLNRKMMTAAIDPKKMTPADRDKLRDEMIASYELALKTTEDQQTRFDLARLYKEAGREEDALKQYDKIMKLLSYSEDPNNRFAYQQLASGYQTVGQAEKGIQATEKFKELEKKAEEERKKQEAAQKAAQKAAEEKAAADKAAAQKAAAEKAKTEASKATPPGVQAPIAPGAGEGGAGATEPKKP